MSVLEWQSLPDGYTIPGVFSLKKIKGTEKRFPIVPICHLVEDDDGRGVDCLFRATWGLPSDESWQDYRTYSCDEHKDEVYAQEMEDE